MRVGVNHMKEQTVAIHAGYNKDGQSTMAVPIYQSTAYEFPNTDYARELFELKIEGNIYTRLMNPTTDVFEKRFSILEGGISGIATASGMSAIFYAIANVAESGDNIIVAKQVYGGTTTLTSHTIKRFGIEARYFNIENPEEINELADDKTKLILFESISNPSIDLADFDKIVKIADRLNIITCVDNTVATPILCKPIDFGCDIVVHSSSKYTTGQGLAIGGIIVEGKSAKSKIVDNPRYSHFNEPDMSYHGLIYSKASDNPFSLRARLSLLRDLGATPSPFNTWLYIQGIETLPLRMVQHSKSALEIAKFLESHPKVKRVNYSGLKSNKNFHLAERYFPKGQSGLLSFELNSLEEAKRVAESTKIFKLVVNIGDSKSIITHPASTTHQQLSKQELIDAGVPEGLIRLSVGLEDREDLIKDLKEALD